jgi:DNA-directed RNA polymerase II subunit RPB2
MIAVHKTMDVPRHVLKTLFSDTAFPLIQHHVDSFNAMLDTGIPTFIKVSNPFELELGDKTVGKDARRFIRVYIGGKDGDKIRYAPPMEDDGIAVVPHACRLDNRTYALKMYADVTIEYEFSNGKKAERYFTDVFIGEIPLMLRSRLCYLTALDPYSIGECKYELGGYFIIDGAEKVLLTQELLGNNMFYAGTRTRRAPKGTLKTLIEKEEPIDAVSGEPDVGYEEVTESYTGIRTLSEDGARGPYSHFLVLPAPTVQKDVKLEEMSGNLGRDGRLAVIQIPGYSQAVPLLSVFRALGVTSDRDLYDMVLTGVSDKSRGVYDQTFQEIVLSHDTYLESTETTDLDILSFYTRSKSRFEVVASLHDSLFSNVEGGEDDTGGLFRRKAYMLAHMLKMAMDVSLGLKPPSDRDNMQFKRLQTSGVMCFEEFRRIYREIGKSVLLSMDSRVQYEAGTYAGEKLANLVDSMGAYWKGGRMLNEYSKSFKGAWGGRVGIAQELARPSYAAVIHHLRKTDLQIDKSISTAPPRRLFASQFGIMCPVDSPDGSDIGYKKALTILAQVSTAIPSKVLLESLKTSGIFRETADIHPSTWRPEWTRIYLNSVLAGACIGDTEELHRQLLAQRREGKFGNAVSLAWMRINNEYRIYSDAGRPIRPVYREGVTPAAVLKAKSWKDILMHIDYIDAVESDSLRISMEPYHPTQPSEIHMSFCMSALANLVPYPDHNPGPRNAFSIAQQKQAASWFHTNYQKRFDTVAMMAVTPQKPLSQTWIYHEIMGRGGCMAYGENAIVAITMYGGHNQEDSMILNGGALKRGMYKTMYYHSYDHAEEMLDYAAQTHTSISNPTKNESIKRKEGKDYKKLDADGIIKVGSVIDENTIMVGMIAPTMSPTGQVTGHRDVSISAKVGHHGRVDAVYTYSTGDGLMGVKIRLIEERTPEIGDKMASRHSQKGTVGMILDEEDMPFSASGLRPDLIFNPHGIPTRMTVGQFLEAGSNKLGLKIGSFIDATPFTQTNRIGELRKSLLENGYEPYGSEVLYNGQTGEMMEADIFMGPIYYQRLKHMVADKINYRDTGPKKLLTKQPTQGRGDEGGLRIGEMERDALIAHGMSKFLTESMMERSDKATLQFDKEHGRFDTSRDMLDVPYSMALFTQELESMHVTLHMEPASSQQEHS